MRYDKNTLDAIIGMMSPTTLASLINDIDGYNTIDDFGDDVLVAAEDALAAIVGEDMAEAMINAERHVV